MSNESDAPNAGGHSDSSPATPGPDRASSKGSPVGVPRWLRAAALFLLVLAVYWPVFHGGFVWDDAVLIDRNSLIKGEASLLTIWFREDFPLSIVALWLQWLAWGKNAAGYHVVNTAFHAANAVLFWRLLARWRVSGAWLAAALFAVHPLAVASVAWISELKNTLSLLFFLLSFIFYSRFDVGRRTSDFGFRTSKWYWLSLGAFLFALLSKTSTVMLPVVMLVCVWWQQGRITRRDVARALPFFALALGFGLLTIWFQAHHVTRGEFGQSEGLAERLAGAGWALWFYLGKMLWPLNLVLIYPRWEISAGSIRAWLPLLLWCGALAGSWWFRRGDGRPLFVALVCLSALLFPVLGLFDTYFLTMSRVSDHFAHLALLPVMAFAGAILAKAAGHRRSSEHSAFALQRPLLKALATAMVLGMAALTLQRSRVFATDEGLWRDTLAKNPDAWVAHNNLGCILAEQGRLDDAERHFMASLHANPRNAEAHRNLGKALLVRGKLAEAEEHLRNAIRLNPNDAEAHRTLASALTEQGKPEDAVAALRAALRIKPEADTRLELAILLRRLGDFAEAVAQLRLAAGADPDAVEVLNNLAWLLATSAEARLRDGTEAVRLAERACQLTGETNAIMVATRAAAYAEAQRFADAVTSAEKAITLANASGNVPFARLNQQLRHLYAARLPYHEPPPSRPAPNR